MATTMNVVDELTALRAAQGGDEQAFRDLVEGRRAELHSHCYRMLASSHDADDAVQEALLRAWKGIGRFEGKSSVRTWLFKITTNTALDLAAKRARRELPVESGSGAWDRTEVHWIEPYRSSNVDDASQPEARYSAREGIELAFVAALQHLPARQRAVFIFREALGFSATETAETLDMTVAAANSALQRARGRVSNLLPGATQQVELRALGPAEVRELASSYARAIEAGDTGALLALLSEDATWSMPPEASWFRGRSAISAFLEDSVFPQRWRHTTVEANGQIAVAGYLFDDEVGGFASCALDVIELRDGLISGVTGFLTNAALSSEVRDANPGCDRLFTRFGLPELLAA
jgi:RNA polymerase sigma-70 factor (ECF subfamily)